MTTVYALDATPMVARPTGIGRYVRELVLGMAPLLASDERLVLHAGVARLNPAFGHDHGVLVELARLPGVRVAKQWLPLSVSYGLARRTGRPRVETFTGRIDLYHGTNYLLPPTRGARRLASIHDLAILLDEGSVPPATHRRFERAVRYAAEHAEAITTLSRASADRIRDLLGVPEERLHVIPPGVTHDFARADPAGEVARRDATLLAACAPLAPVADGTPFLLFVGTTFPRKNVPRLVRAWDDVVRETGAPHHLVLAGAAGHDEPAVDAARAGTARPERVHRAGYVDEATLGALYRRCAALALVSRDEGFGLPALEALSCGRPVLVSRRGALPEVCGDAAHAADPDDPAELARALADVLLDADLRVRLSARGPARAALHTRDRSAEAHLALYRSLR